MTNDQSAPTRNDLPGFREAFGYFLAVVLAIVIGIALLAVIGWFLLPPDTTQVLVMVRNRDIIVYAVSWVVLLLISIAATVQIREIIPSNSQDFRRRRADLIAVIVGLILTLILFQQQYLDRLFGATTANFWITTLLLGGGALSGWVVWYLRQLATYGEFFHVLLLTIVTGFSWYARLTAPEEVQRTAVAFLLGSLFRIAKDYMDVAARPSAQNTST